MSWEDFQKHFKGKYMTERYYDDRSKDFHELKPGKTTMNELVTKFTHI